MTIWEAIILGLVQGLTEMLPVSSSGHLVLGQYLLGLDASMADDLSFEVFTHFGTTMSIVTVYWKRIVEIIKATFSSLSKPAQFAVSYRENKEFKIAMHILLSMIPTGLVYILLKDWLEAAFGDPRFVAGMLIVTGLLLLATRLRPNPDGKVTPLKALTIGLAQAGAMIPGISRSGSTICAAIYQNVEQEQAANFSFLMVLPVIIGATLLQTLEMLEGGLTVPWLTLLVGAGVAYVFGIIAIKIVLSFVRKGNISYFAYYCFLIGALGLIFIK